MACIAGAADDTGADNPGYGLGIPYSIGGTPQSIRVERYLRRTI